MKKSFLILYINGFLRAAKMLLEYPYIEKLWDKLNLVGDNNQDKYIVNGFAVVGFVIGLIGAMFLWIITALLNNTLGVIIGMVLLFLILELKDHCSGLILLSKYIVFRLSGNSHLQSWKSLEQDCEFENNSLSGVVLTIILLMKLAGYFVIIQKNCEFMLVPLLMVNYCTQGFFASNRNFNNKVFFHLELHELEAFCIFSAILLFVGVHFNFVIWLFVAFVFALQYFVAYKISEITDYFGVNTLTLAGEVSEFILLIILSLYII